MGIEQAIDITLSQRKTVLALIQQYLPGVVVWVYGSRAKWTSRPQSDLDLVAFASPEQKDRVGDLREAFEESDLPFRVDLFVWDEVPESFRTQIEVEHVELVEKDGAVIGVWPKVILGDCVTINESTYSPKEAWPFINYLDTGNIQENQISEIQYLIKGKSKIPSRAKRKIQPGDIVYSTVRPNQKHFGLLKETPENFLVSTGFATIRGKKGIADTDFVYWYLTQSHIIEYLHTMAEHSVSAYPSIRPKDIQNLNLALPPLSEQHAIAHVLNSLDNKIKLNRGMNETLEEIVRALFKSWFVDFDPVRAKMENRDTGLPKHIADLFPDRLVESELGRIPEEWSIGYAGDIFEQLHEKENPLAHPRHKFQYFSIPEFDKGRWPKTEFGANIKSQKSKVPPDAILLSKLNPDIERVWAVDVTERDRAICSTEFLVLLPRPAFGRAFVYSFACSSFFQHRVQTLVTGTSKSHQRAQAKAILGLSVVIPPVFLSRLFEEIGEMLLCRIIQCHRESKLLSTLRDTLLPKLISGELRVKGYERSNATI